MLTLVPTLKKTCRGKCGRELPLDAFGVQARGLFGRKSECKTCLAEKEAARRAADPEAARAYKRQWWAERQWTPEEREAAAAKARAWYSVNKDRHQESFYRWVRDNPEAFRIIQARRRGRKAEVLSTLTEEEWLTIQESFGHCCAYCLRGDMKLTMDHITPISKGGPHTTENVVPSCGPCNSRKKDRLIFCMLNQAA